MGGSRTSALRIPAGNCFKLEKRLANTVTRLLSLSTWRLIAASTPPRRGERYVIGTHTTVRNHGISSAIRSLAVPCTTKKNRHKNKKQPTRITFSTRSFIFFSSYSSMSSRTGPIPLLDKFSSATRGGGGGGEGGGQGPGLYRWSTQLRYHKRSN